MNYKRAIRNLFIFYLLCIVGITSAYAQQGGIGLSYANEQRLNSLTEVYISRVEDFPTPYDAGDGYGVAIHLEDGVKYILDAPIFLSYELVLPENGNTFITSTLGTKYPLVYLGTNALFNQSKVGALVLHLVVISAPTGTIFDIDAQQTLEYTGQTGDFTVGQIVEGDTSKATGLIVADDDQGTSGTLTLENVDKRFIDGEPLLDPLTGAATSVGTNTTDGLVVANLMVFTNFAAWGSIKTASFSGLQLIVTNGGNGLVLDSTQLTVASNITFNDWQNNSTSFITVQGYHDALRFNQNFASLQSNESFLNIDPTSVFNAGTIAASTFITSLGGTVFAPGSRNQTDEFIRATGNSGLADSIVIAASNYDNPAGGTITIPAQNAKVLVDFSGWVSDVTERIIENTNGFAIYDGLEEATVAVDGNIYMAQVLGTNKILHARVVVILVSQGETTITFDNTTNIVNDVGTERLNGDIISFKNSSGGLPPELSKSLLYYVVNQTVDSFQLAYTDGGTPIAFTTNGVGTHMYEMTEPHGALATVSVDSNIKPVDFIIQALFRLKKGDQIWVYVTNQTDANDINVFRGYRRIKQ